MKYTVVIRSEKMEGLYQLFKEDPSLPVINGRYDLLINIIYLTCFFFVSYFVACHMYLAAHYSTFLLKPYNECFNDELQLSVTVSFFSRNCAL